MYIFFQLFDITKDSVSNLGGTFGLVHDKGTYDAISLNPDNPKEHRQMYIDQTAAMIAERGKKSSHFFWFLNVKRILLYCSKFQIGLSLFV